MSEGLELMKKMLGECQYIAKQEGATFFCAFTIGETTHFLGHGNGSEMAVLLASLCRPEPAMGMILQMALGVPIEVFEDEDNTEND
jgi:hypothetical protein